MKYKVGDLVSEKYGNIDKPGYISSINEKNGYLTVVFFDSSNNEFSFHFHYFERYYKIL